MKYKFSVLQSDLSNALGIVAISVAKKTTLPILSNVAISIDPENNIAVLNTTDLELYSQTCIPIQSKEKEKFGITINLSVFQSYIDKISDENIDFIYDDEIGRLHLKQGGYKAYFQTLSYEEFPTDSFQIDEKETFELEFDKDHLLNIIALTSFAASKEESRPVLTALQIRFETDKITFLALDGYRLSKVDYNTETPNILVGSEFLVPVQSLTRMRSFLSKSTDSLKITFQKDRFIKFEIGLSYLISNLIEGQYPDVSAMLTPLSDISNVIKFPVDGLKKSLEVCNIFTTGNTSNKLLLVDVMAENGVTITSSDDNGENVSSVESHYVKNCKEDFKAGFLSNYLQDFINAVSARNNVILYTNGSNSILIWKVEPMLEVMDFTHIIMPITLEQ